MSKILIVFTFLLSSYWVMAQGDRQVIPCGETEITNLWLDNDPVAKKRAEESRVAFERFFDKWQANQGVRKTSSGAAGYIIPVVVHVFHATTGDKISMEQIQSVFESLNQDYRAIPGTWGLGGLASDGSIQFELATLDPNRLPTTGVKYYLDPETANFAQIQDEPAAYNNAWNRNRYLNIYVVNSISGGPVGQEILGYTYKAINANGALKDGIYIRADCFGNSKIFPGGRYYQGRPIFGRTATHEIGHWLNLSHTFGDIPGCGGLNCKTTGDFCCDTPPTSDQNFGCGGARQNSCTNDSPDFPDNLRNYMDYLDDACVNYFSRCQYQRMTSCLETQSLTQRNGLWQTENHLVTGTGKYGPPMAVFWTNNTHYLNHSTCAGNVVKFLDFSRNMPDDPECTFKWEFEGGNPATSTDREPEVMYANSGSYKVSLTVNNLSQKPNTMTKNNFVIVEPNTGRNLPLVEGFEGTAFPPTDWRRENPDSLQTTINGRTFDKVTTAGGFAQSASCMRMRHDVYSDYGQRDAMVTPILQLGAGADISKLSLRFAVAYSGYTGTGATATTGAGKITYYDTLGIYVSNDCGYNWNKVFREGGADLGTIVAASTLTNWKPGSGDWENVEVLLDNVGLTENSKFQLKFETVNGWGSNLYLDDINVDILTSNDNQIINPQTVRVVPNPFEQTTNVRFSLNHPSNVFAEIFDVNGKCVYKTQPETLSNGNNNLTLSPNVVPGVYVLKLHTDTETTMQKLVTY